MLLVIAIGSSNIRIGLYEGDKLRMQTSMRVDTQILPDEYAVKIQSALGLFGCRADEVEGAILSSVMPPLTFGIHQAVERLCHVRPLVVGPGLRTGLPIRINDPAQLGSDLVTQAVAAREMKLGPTVVCSLGTATTFVLMDGQGAVRGASIAPGMKISLESLARHTAQLPWIDLETPPPGAVGKTTVDSMKSGLLLGTACLVEGMTKRMEEELGEDVSLILTGTFAPLIAPLCRRECRTEPDLILEGLRLIYERHREKRGERGAK